MFVVIGCADLTMVGDNGAPHWMERNGDLAVFGCNGSSATWQLKCDGDRWVGDQGVCPGVSSSGIIASFGQFALFVVLDALFASAITANDSTGN